MVTYLWMRNFFRLLTKTGRDFDCLIADSVLYHTLYALLKTLLEATLVLWSLKLGFCRFLVLYECFSLLMEKKDLRGSLHVLTGRLSFTCPHWEA